MKNKEQVEQKKRNHRRPTARPAIREQRNHNDEDQKNQRHTEHVEVRARHQHQPGRRSEQANRRDGIEKLPVAWRSRQSSHQVRVASARLV